MNIMPDVTYEEFFIGEDKYAIRPLERGDFNEDFSSCLTLPDATKSSFQFGLKPSPAQVKIDGIYDFTSRDAFAYVAFKNNAIQTNEHWPVAYAVCAKNTIYQANQFFMSIDEKLKSTRLPLELFSVLVIHAKTLGGESLFCHASENNIEMRALAEKTKLSTRLLTNKPHGVVYSMVMDNHPGRIKFQTS